MKIIGIIPARLASKRFPNKPLEDIHGMPMIGHVYHRSKMCTDLQEVYVATCDKKIADYITGIGGSVIMTSDEHIGATDRTAEAVLKIEAEINEKIDIVVMLQADEPLLSNQMIANALSPLIIDEKINIVNLMTEIRTEEEFQSPNIIKTVVDINNFALYFSREPIPSLKKGSAGFPSLKQVCIIPFRRDFLLEYSAMAPTPLEIAESIDMMRILENGMKVKMVFSEKETHSVDAPEDLKKVKKLILEDFYTKKYLTGLN